MDCIYIIIGFIISYSVYTSVCRFGPSKIDCPCLINNKIKGFHLHHWFIHLIILVGQFIFGFDTGEFYSILLGINLGGIFHGIYMYNDWADISIHLDSD